jgi:hypothetical protein
MLGYGFQQLNDVLLQTHYLSSRDLLLTHRRLAETFQMIAHAMNGSVDDFDQTLADVVRVRLLHGMVRYRILKGRSKTNDDDVPINQEDSLITLLGFSFGVLYCVEERMHIRLSDDDKQAYLHLWRYIGWVIGVEDDLLEYLSSYRLARIISESIFYHFYYPSTISKHLVHHSLMATYRHGHLPFSFQLFVGMSQLLLGKSFSEALEIDRPVIDRLHRWTIALLVRSFRWMYWLTSLKWTVLLNRWLIDRRRQQLAFLVAVSLNHQPCNFAQFKRDRSSNKDGHAVSLKDCSCGYYQKKQTGQVFTSDFGLLRGRRCLSFDDDK